MNIPDDLTRIMIGRKLQELCDAVKCDGKCGRCIIEKIDIDASRYMDKKHE